MPKFKTVAYTKAEALPMMFPPSRTRETKRGGVIQIMLTRACDKACFHCTQGSNLRGKSVMITLEEFELACQSLKNPDYWGIVGLFGGNPALHPKFPEICEIFKSYFPLEQRGVWCNHPKGHGKLMRATFNPWSSNLNVHKDREAYNEFVRDWPECKKYILGLKDDSHHSPSAFFSMKDVIHDEAERWNLIANCDINRYWSAMVCPVPNRGLRAYFCEIAAAQAMLRPDWPDTGLPAEQGWWTKPMSDFASQVELHCHQCGVPLKREGQLAIDGKFEETTQTYLEIYKPKQTNREVRCVSADDGKHLGLFTDYIGNAR